MKVSLDIRESFAGYIAPSYEFTNKSSSSNNFCVEFPLFGKSIAKVTPFLEMTSSQLIQYHQGLQNSE